MAPASACPHLAGPAQSAPEHREKHSEIRRFGAWPWSGARPRPRQGAVEGPRCAFQAVATSAHDHFGLAPHNPLAPRTRHGGTHQGLSALDTVSFRQPRGRKGSREPTSEAAGSCRCPLPAWACPSLGPLMALTRRPPGVRSPVTQSARHRAFRSGHAARHPGQRRRASLDGSPGRSVGIENLHTTVAPREGATRASAAAADTDLA